MSCNELMLIGEDSCCVGNDIYICLKTLEEMDVFCTETKD
jgi:hypothetical protein